MAARLVSADKRDFAGLWTDMLSAHHDRIELECVIEERRQSLLAGTEEHRQLRRALRIAMKERYGKAAKYVAFSPTIYPIADGVLETIERLHPEPGDPVPVISEAELPPKPTFSPLPVSAALRKWIKISRRPRLHGSATA